MLTSVARIESVNKRLVACGEVPQADLVDPQPIPQPAPLPATANTLSILTDN